MGLIENIRSIFKKKQVIPSTNITLYDTSSISIPKYSELSEDAKKVVDGYIEEVDFEKLDTLMLFADEMSEYANANTQLLLKLFFRITQKPLESELSRLTDEEIAERKLDALIQREEVGLYKQVLENLQEESTLRAVALEEIKRRKSKRKSDFLRLFEREEREKRLKRKNQMELLERATERMKISKKTIEQQMAVVKIEIESEESIATSLDVYNAISNKDKDVLEKMASSDKEEVQLMHRVDQTLQMASLVIPQDADILKKIYINVKLDELSTMRVLDKKRAIKALAIIQRKLDVYAYTHRGDLEQLRQEVFEIDRQEKTTKNREELLSKVNRIQTMYKIFGQYVTPEDLQSLYQAKFDVLTIGANEQEKSPFAEIKNKEEMGYYGKIIEAKLEDILLGRNAYFANEFGENQYDAIKIIKNIIKKEIGEYSGEKILANKRVLAFLLAFENEDGMNDFVKGIYFKKEEIVDTRKEDIFELQEMVSLDIIRVLDEEMYSTKKKSRPWVGLLTLSKYKYTKKDTEEELILPEGIKSIGEKVFSYCGGLIKVKFNEGLQRIGAEAFYRCRSLTEVKFNEGLQSIGYRAFSYCDSLTEVKFNEGLQRIGYRAFYECASLTEVKFNEGLQRIGAEAFYGCSSLKKLEFNEGLQSIGMCAFQSCCSLTEVKFNEGLQSTGDLAFYSCCSLTEVKFNERLQSIGNSAFSGCSSLTEVEFNEGLQSIGDCAFSGCSSLTKVKFNEGLQNIGYRAFVNCSSLEEVVINEGIKTIDDGAFMKTSSLEQVSVPTHKIDIKSSIFGYGEGCNPERTRTITLRVRGLNLEEGCLEQYLRFDIGRIKSIEIMDGKNVAILYNLVDSDDPEKVVKKVEQLIQEYKQRRMNKPQQQDETR